MSHFAELNKNNEVIRVIVGNNEDPNGDEGYNWIVTRLGGTWVKTSYNNNFRKQFAGTGFTYDLENDVFVKPTPFASWILNDNFDWQPPTPMPELGKYFWDEDSVSWVELNP